MNPSLPNPPVVWTIAGSDNSAGAGIQADLHTLRSFGIAAATVVTCVTAQNSVGLAHLELLSTTTLQAQLDTLAAEATPAVVKIGALGSDQHARHVITFLESLMPRPFVIWDPVVTASVGGELSNLTEATLAALLECADVVTPNTKELSHWGIDVAPLHVAAKALTEKSIRPTSVYLKGGHSDTPGTDYWIGASEHGRHAKDAHRFYLNSTPLGDIEQPVQAHGSGCCLASALAAAYALGHDLDELPVLAHMYVRQGLRQLDAQHDRRSYPALPHLGWPDQLTDLPHISADPIRREAPFAPLTGPLGLYAVVENAAWVERCVKAGVPTVQLRYKDANDPQLSDQIARSIAVTRNSATQLFINDHWRLAIEYGAYGIHLGQEDLDDADLDAIRAADIRLGISNHSYYELGRAHALQPSYIALGPIYATTTKAMVFVPRGLDRLQRWVKLLSAAYPLTAIGGIDHSRIAEVRTSGIDSVAVVRAITEADNPEAAIAALTQALTD